MRILHNNVKMQVATDQDLVVVHAKAFFCWCSHLERAMRPCFCCIIPSLALASSVDGCKVLPTTLLPCLTRARRSGEVSYRTGFASMCHDPASCGTEEPSSTSWARTSSTVVQLPKSCHGDDEKVIA